VIEIDHFIVSVSDWDKSRVFYETVVGATVVDHPDGNIALRYGTTQLNLLGPGINTLQTGRVLSQPGATDMAFVWPGSPEEAIAHLDAHGVERLAGPVARYGGRGRGVSVYFRDPDGSLLEFISYQRQPTEEEITNGYLTQELMQGPRYFDRSPE
jgi:catechol 2,3-dioxygenase-like lactoylglutathione lyase family enzyme